MYQEQIENYYSRKDVQKAILELCEGREVIPVLASGSFGKRPNAVFYERDIEALVKEGSISLHGSVERWNNPLQLSTDMKASDMDKLRVGWDLIIDIDCNRDLKYSKIATKILVKALEQYGIKSYSIKFSGNRGFHIGVPFESFPAEIMGLGGIEKQYPRIPKAVIEYLGAFTYNEMKAEFNEEPSKVITIDSGLIAPRHLFRLPYCLHRKTWLVSIPLKLEELDGFEKEQAKPENVEVKTKFLDTMVEEESTELLQSTLFWASRKEEKAREKPKFKVALPTTAIRPEYFPPCMKNILQGLEDGRKRSVFVLATFLHRIGWKEPEIREFILDWNTRNKEPLREGFIKTTLNNQFSRETPQMAPNCKNMGYYKSYGVCTPDNLCATIKNPVSYTLNRIKGIKKKRRKKSGKLSGNI